MASGTKLPNSGLNLINGTDKVTRADANLQINAIEANASAIKGQSDFNAFQPSVDIPTANYSNFNMKIWAKNGVAVLQFTLLRQSVDLQAGSVTVLGNLPVNQRPKYTLHGVISTYAGDIAFIYVYATGEIRLFTPKLIPAGRELIGYLTWPI